MTKSSLISLLVTTTFLSTPSFGMAEEAVTSDDMNEIIVVSSKVNRKLEDVIGNVSVITGEDIQNQMITNLSQMFRKEPGVTVTGGSGQAQNILVRGMGGDRVLMIKDGMRMNEGYGADGLNDIVGRGFIDTDTLKQVEVAKGPASSLYGADAMGGIVVFSTKDAVDYLGDNDFYIGGKAGYEGRNNQYSYGATVAARFGGLENLLIVTRREGNETQNFADNRVPLDVDSWDILAKSRFVLDDANYLQLTYNRYSQDTLQPDSGNSHGLWQNLTGYQITLITDAEEKFNQSFKLDFHSEGDWYETFDLGLYQNRTEQTNDNLMILDIDSPYIAYVGPRNMQSLGVYKQETFGLLSNLVASMELGGFKHQFAIGFDVETTESSRVTTEYRTQGTDVILDQTAFKFPENDVLRTGVYMTDYIDVIPDMLTVNAGLRFDYTKMTPDVTQNDAGFTYEKISDNNLSANIGASFQATENITLIATYAQGFKTPPYDLAYIFHDNSLYGYKVLPADNLVPETSDSFELGIKGSWDDLEISLFAYQNMYNNFITIAKVGEEVSYPYGPGYELVVNLNQYQNIDRVKIKGVEMKISYQATEALQLYANAALQTGKDRDTGDYITSIEPFSGIVGASYAVENWAVDATLRWAESMKKVNAGQYINPGYAVFDLTASVKLMDGVLLRGGLFNAFNKEYTSYKSVAGSLLGDHVNARTNAGRTVSAKVTFGF
ncbi:MAG: TonB-dependent hemoglobin/transferrin/lactoferrin family receptor [Emcibacter sp.]|nr:TonB-dependent hemoglobin/transferrin/lactoferrin family receptor [Emcibacter sp.]